MKEARFAMLARSNPNAPNICSSLAQKDIDDQWHYYEQMAGVERDIADEYSIKSKPKLDLRITCPST